MEGSINKSNFRNAGGEVIAVLEEKKNALITPKMTPTQIIKAAQDKGWTIEQIMKKLGI